MAHAFTIRSIPKNIHHSWKLVSHLQSVSMRLYLLRALRRQIERDVETMQQEKILTTQQHKLEEL